MGKLIFIPLLKIFIFLFVSIKFYFFCNSTVEINPVSYIIVIFILTFIGHSFGISKEKNLSDYKISVANIEQNNKKYDDLNKKISETNFFWRELLQSCTCNNCGWIGYNFQLRSHIKNIYSKSIVYEKEPFITGIENGDSSEIGFGVEPGFSCPKCTFNMKNSVVSSGASPIIR